MSAPSALEMMIQSDRDDPRCEVVFSCVEHGDEECSGRARWVAIVTCPNGATDQILVCDDCHDQIEADGNTLGKNNDHRVEWRPL